MAGQRNDSVLGDGFEISRFGNFIHLGTLSLMHAGQTALECPLLAHSGHCLLRRTCLLLTQSGHAMRLVCKSMRALFRRRRHMVPGPRAGGKDVHARPVKRRIVEASSLKADQVQKPL